LVEKKFNFIVPGGGATGGPPIGPALGPMGVNIMNIVAEINKQTGEYKGTPVPVDVVIDTDTREFTVKVGMLSTFALLTQAVKITKGSGTPHSAKVGDLSFEELIRRPASTPRPLSQRRVRSSEPARVWAST
jgi:large subunit ribosomal protein L11